MVAASPEREKKKQKQRRGEQRGVECGIIELKLQDTAGCNLRHGALAAKFNRSDETVGCCFSVAKILRSDLHRNANQGVPVELSEQVASNLSKRVVSVALFDGQTVLFACSGIPVECLGNVTRFVTSARLAKAFNDKKKDHDDLKVLVRHEDKVVTGFLDKYDSYLNIAAVNVMDMPDLHTLWVALLYDSSVQLTKLLTLYLQPDGMILVNTFEEPFGDECGEGVWSELSETTCDILKRNIVALASFCEGKRIFACTGLFIEWKGFTAILTSASLLREPGCEDQKIVKNLRIEVLLPNKGRAEGKLQHVSLHYNVALVSVKDFCASQPAVKVEHRWPDSGKVLAVGCCFSSGRLMAARGQKYGRPNVQFDCKYLGYSTCKITKAGIGGPLADLDGKFVGMNFYDKYVGHTPYLSWREIVPLLEYFETKGPVAEGGDYGNPSDKPDWTKEGDNSVSCNSWFVPSPRWYDPDVLEKVEREALSIVPRYLPYDCISESDSESE
ncbi:uncharacterized protein [Triticum aestivum]|uniref:uncharacterized protein n=1 Tax=Triticum aestivum TaxID=4565 RepID=UPI001D00E3DF|nr:uncharacterized protein LOC123055715 [Triticum aestivum]